MTPDAPASPAAHDGFAGRLAAAFIRSPLAPLITVAAILLGIWAVVLLPREEEPQIRVPMMDVLVRMPGADTAETARRVARPMEQLIAEIPGVEYVYSNISPGAVLTIVRFKVGEDVEKSLVLLNQKLQTNADRIPPGVSPPLVKPRSIDDVPVLAYTLHGGNHGPESLRRIAVQLADELKRVPEVAEVRISGGLRREIRVEPDLAAMQARGISWNALAERLSAENQRSDPTPMPAPGGMRLLQAGATWTDAADIARMPVTDNGGRIVCVSDVARVTDGPEDTPRHVFHGGPGMEPEPAVTLSIAKRPGANAITVVNAVQDLAGRLRGTVIPPEVGLTVSRDYGHTAAEKSNELLLHMGIAVAGVSLLILAFLGWRASLVVAMAIPVTLALTLLVFHLAGYTLNRITLFALIFSIGILVDDAIVVLENIFRHQALPKNAGRPFHAIATEAVAEVGNPTVLATMAVIAAIVPMAFVGGLMGPYMRPIPVGATTAMVFSMLVAFALTPWAAHLVLGRHAPAHTEDKEHDLLTRLYHRVMEPLLDSHRWRTTFLAGILVLLAAAMLLVPIGAVRVKMLPYDDKSELQLVLDMPETATAETTLAVGRELAEAVSRDSSVRDWQLYVGDPAPHNFNGLVRHYYLRGAPFQADIQVNLKPRGQRDSTSHAVALRLRPVLTSIAARHGARLTVAEIPPGPPVLQTLVAEVYAPDDASRLALAREVRRLFAGTPGVVDINWYVDAPASRTGLTPDLAKSASHGVSSRTLTDAIDGAVGGRTLNLLHDSKAGEDVPVRLVLARADRARPESVLGLLVGGDGHAKPAVPVGEVAHLATLPPDPMAYHKNQLPVTYIVADVAGDVEGPLYAVAPLSMKLAQLDARRFGGKDARIAQWHITQPVTDLAPAVKWDGEWHLTLEVFRDLGIAFAAVLVAIYALMVGWFRSFAVPLVVMAAIPFSLIGILPAHALAGSFFSATSMIGFMAGAGIVVRNSIILVDFIRLRRAEGLPLRDAVVEAGAVRFRPMLLTALAVVVGSAVILRDPIFQGLAISLLAGEIASLLISRLAVPVLYYMFGERTPSPVSPPPPV